MICDLTNSSTGKILAALAFSGELGVKGLAVVLLGMVFGSGFNGCPQAKNSPQSGNGFGR